MLKRRVSKVPWTILFLGQSENLVGKKKNCIFAVMEKEDLIRYFLSPVIVDIFDVVRIEDNTEEWRMDIYLDERKVKPSELEHSDVISYGFTESTTIQDFPIRGKGVYLHLRRRKWLDKVNNQIITRKIDLVHEGTDLTRDFVSFLKATN